MNRIDVFRMRATAARYLRACTRIGSNPVLHGKPTVRTGGPGRIEIGDHFYLSSLPVPSHLISWGMLRVGDDVSIGHGGAIAATRDVSIGDRTHIGPFFVLMDTDFHGERAKAGARPTTNTASGPDSGYAPVCIGADVRIGAHVTVLRGATIGDGARIASRSVVSGTITDGALAAGVPARALSDSTELRNADIQTSDVLSIVMRVFGLSAPPDRRSGPDDIPQWDSLGGLKLLLALEDTLGLALDEDVVAQVRTVGELERAVEHAQRLRISNHELS